MSVLSRKWKVLAVIITSHAISLSRTNEARETGQNYLREERER
jgi:hypothetical protein